MSENSKKAARVNSLKKKLQVRRAATGGPKGDFYIIGGAVTDSRCPALRRVDSVGGGPSVQAHRGRVNDGVKRGLYT